MGLSPGLSSVQKEGGEEGAEALVEWGPELLNCGAGSGSERYHGTRHAPWRWMLLLGSQRLQPSSACSQK